MTASTCRLLCVASWLASFALFWVLLGYRVAVLLTGTVLVHELAHAAAFRRYGYPLRALFFALVVGGAVPVTSDRKRGVEWIAIALAGPASGIPLAATLLLAAQLTGDAFFLWGAYVVAFINVINLLPIFPLDGGHVAMAVAGTRQTEGRRALSMAATTVAGVLCLLGTTADWGWVAAGAVWGLMGVVGATAEDHATCTTTGVAAKAAVGLGIVSGSLLWLATYALDSGALLWMESP